MALRRGLARGFDNPWLLLGLTCLFWGANVPAARLSVGEISPMVLVTGRWGIALGVLVMVGRRALVADWPVIARHMPRTVLMGAFGFTAFHALYFLAAQYTSGVNISIIQAVTPALVFLAAWLFLGLRVLPMQALGCLLTIAGIVLVAAQGDLRTLATLAFNRGDLIILAATFVNAGYTLSLRDRPAASPLGFFVALAIVAFVTALPLLALEVWAGDARLPTARGWAVLIYVAIFSTILGQIFFIRAVELIGPGRAALFFNLTPVIGATMSVALLGEGFHLYHALALALVVGGVTMAERLRR